MKNNKGFAISSMSFLLITVFSIVFLTIIISVNTKSRHYLKIEKNAREIIGETGSISTEILNKTYLFKIWRKGRNWNTNW